MSASFTCGYGNGTSLPPVDPDWLCCEAAAYSDGRACSCWVEVYTRPRPTLTVEGPMAVRDTLCHDCAYRPGSPERVELGGEQLNAPITRPFACHQGMPVLLGYTVPDWCTEGVWREGAFSVPASLVHDRDNFDPLIRGAQLWTADLTLGEVCAGWAAASGARRKAPARA